MNLTEPTKPCEVCQKTEGPFTKVEEGTQPAEQATIPSPRYVVQKAEPHGYHVIDTTGIEQPYLINTMDLLDDYGRALLTPAYVRGYEESSRHMAQDRADTWNLVEQGYCGQCKQKISEMRGYQSGPNGEPPLRRGTFEDPRYRAICFYCSYSVDN